MDVNSDQLRLKKILVDLEDEHKHLQVSINHLETEIEKREIEIKKLLAERELELARENHERLKESRLVDFNEAAENISGEAEFKPVFSSEFTEQVSQLLNRITKASEEVSSLIRL